MKVGTAPSYPLARCTLPLVQHPTYGALDLRLHGPIESRSLTHAGRARSTRLAKICPPIRAVAVGSPGGADVSHHDKPAAKAAPAKKKAAPAKKKAAPAKKK